MVYDFKKIEQKWQKKWEEGKIFEVKESKKKKYYVLEMFPYPSASGLHMGHALNYTIGDVFARFKRMNGFNVLYPMGFDALGLPAENAAIKAKSHPKPFTKTAIKNYTRQMQELGLSYDWSKLVLTMEPEYYRWNQYFFLKFLEKGLIYRKKAPVNWCPKCKTVLANEQVHNGMCWRHEDSEVEIKHLEQWFIKTTAYADELLEKVNELQWPERIKIMQKNWIGKSFGTEIDFEFEIPMEILNVVIVHGCPSNDKKAMNPETRTYDKHWIPWVKKKLEERGIKVVTPLMPEPWNPKYKNWKTEFDKLSINENSVLVGHSCSCAFLVRWLGETKRKVRKLILVAPWKIPSKEFSEEENKLYDYKIDRGIKERADKIIIFTSNDEEEDGKESVKIFHNEFGGEIIELKNHGHFILGDMGTNEFPELLQEINSNQKFSIFTTRPDTIYGVTFMVISAQHPKLMELVDNKQKKEVEKFLKRIKSVSEKDAVDLEKEGVFTGSYAVNPLTNEKVPVYAGNFVIADYGSGLIMSVPAHDQRDFDFAKRYNIPIKYVIESLKKEEITIILSDNDMSEIADKIRKISSYNEQVSPEEKSFNVKIRNKEEILPFLKDKRLLENGDSFIIKYPHKEKIIESVGAFIGEGRLINSGNFNGINNREAILKITEYLEKNKFGRFSVAYKLKDWLVSRQRYWGAPIPIIYCDKCGIVPVPEKDLPIKLPEKVKFGRGNPLATNEDFVNTKCPKCGKKARRETDTMDTFFDSSWYYLRYCDNKNNKEAFDKQKVEYWMPVDQYIGGAEHACMHLIYARFFIKALRDLGFVKFDEPFIKLFNQGMLHGPDGEKMSKSKGNVINPDEVSKKYGMDTARFFLLSLAAPDKPRDWSEDGIEGSLKFIRKIVNYFESIKVEKSDAKIESKLNKTIKDVTNYIENFEYNLAIIQIRELFNLLPSEASKDVLEKSLKLLHPFCPHITEELWHNLGNKTFISLEKWPVADESKIDEKLEKQEQAVEKLAEDINHIKNLVKDEKKRAFIYVLPNELSDYKDSLDLIKKKINLDISIYAVNDKNKYDPENKSKKVKPGRPGIYLE